MSSFNESEVGRAAREVLAGDPDRYEVVYRACDRPLRGFVGRRYGHLGPDFVDEVAVRTHERVFRLLARYDPARSGFQSWVNWQARSVASQVVKARYGRRREPSDPDELAAGPGPAELSERARRCRVVREEVAALPGDLRRVVELRFLEGRTLAETARGLGRSCTQVWRQEQRALPMLARRLRRREVAAAERDASPLPVWGDWDATGYDEDDWTASVAAGLPVGPVRLVGRAAREPGPEERGE